jgi:hypothetical protein
MNTPVSEPLLFFHNSIIGLMRGNVTRRREKGEVKTSLYPLSSGL